MQTEIKFCILRKLAKDMKATTFTKKKHETNNMKIDFPTVIFSDGGRATLDGPDGLAKDWIL